MQRGQISLRLLSGTEIWHRLILREPLLGSTDVIRSVPVKVPGSVPNPNCAAILAWLRPPTYFRSNQQTEGVAENDEVEVVH